MMDTTHVLIILIYATAISKNVERGKVIVNYIYTKQIQADMMTNGLGTDTFKLLREVINSKAKVTMM